MPPCRYLDDTIAHLRKGIAKVEAASSRPGKKGEPPAPARKVRPLLPAAAGLCRRRDACYCITLALALLSTLLNPSFNCCRRPLPPGPSPPHPHRWSASTCTWPTALAAGRLRCWPAWRRYLTRARPPSRPTPCSRRVSGGVAFLPF